MKCECPCPPPPHPSPTHQISPNSPSSVIQYTNTSGVINTFSEFIASIIRDTRREDLDILSGMFADKNRLEISFRDYMELLITHVEKNDPKGENTMLYMIFLLTRLRQKGISINYYNVARIILILLILVTKLLDDNAYTNSDWAYLFMLRTNEINSMEMKLLKILDYDIFIRDEHIKHIMKCII